MMKKRKRRNRKCAFFLFNLNFFFFFCFIGPKQLGITNEEWNGWNGWNGWNTRKIAYRFCKRWKCQECDWWMMIYNNGFIVTIKIIFICAYWDHSGLLYLLPFADVSSFVHQFRADRGWGGFFGKSPISLKWFAIYIHFFLFFFVLPDLIEGLNRQAANDGVWAISIHTQHM